MVADWERINHLEWRIKRLEDFIGKPAKNRIIETINSLNEQVSEYANNSLNGRKLILKVDQINRLISPNFQRHLLEDRLAKRELILADEQRIRNVTQSLSTIDTLARVLQGDCFQEIPKLFATLSTLLTTHENIKNDYGDFTRELSTFLQDYAAFTLLMDENLQQYKSIMNRNQQSSAIANDDPLE